MKNLLAVVLCLPLLCCTDANDTKGDDAADEAINGDAEASETGEETDEPSGANDAGAKDPRDASTPRDSAVAAMDSGNGNSSKDAGGSVSGNDSGTAPDARVASDAGASGSDANTSGDASYGGASRCTGSGLKFCDDFEGTQIDPGWTDKEGTLELDGTNPAMRGQKSLHVRTTNGSPSIMAHRASFPMPNERFWTRMFVKIKNLPTPDWAHWSIMWMIPQGQQWSVVEHRAVGGQNQSDKKFYWAVGTDQGSSGDWTNIDTSSTVQLDKWTCVETLVDSNQDISQVYRDGVEIKGLGTTRATMHAGNSSTPYDIPALRTLWLGFFYYQAETPGQSYDVWIDSFALDGERIGCTR
jgi:hypothetical protein